MRSSNGINSRPVVSQKCLKSSSALLSVSGPEPCRGLGAVLLGELTLSTVLTLLIIPPMLSLLEHTLEKDRLHNQDLKSRPGLAEAAE
ncbi:hypothetical protein [Kiloniella majae]|uniref:hypothetical protein n=1 Tax=Kiloniella majae TaxID=1938558 RepID=UPI000F7771A1|nr:hypothetical protein [Kiloniella majae]